jgi:hypothetical protein
MEKKEEKIELEKLINLCLGELSPYNGVKMVF